MTNNIKRFSKKIFRIRNKNAQTNLPITVSEATTPTPITDLPATSNNSLGTPPTNSLATTSLANLPPANTLPSNLPATTAPANLPETTPPAISPPANSPPTNLLPTNMPTSSLSADALNNTSIISPQTSIVTNQPTASLTMKIMVDKETNTSIDMPIDTVICKPGNEWTQDDLDYYKIKTKSVDEKEFFGQSVDKVVLNDIPDSFFQYRSYRDLTRNAELQQIVNKENKCLLEFMFHMNKALGGTEVEESGLADFATYLLYIFDYNTWKRAICTRQRIGLIMGLKTTYVMSDVCIMDMEYNILFLVQEDKWYMRDTYPKAEIITGAIAAFQCINSNRDLLLKKPLDTYTFPCLTIRGGREFIFYKITVNQSLSDAVKYGISPETTSTMQVYSPTESMSSDIFNSSCRKKIMQCLKLFKDHIKDFDTAL